MDRPDGITESGDDLGSLPLSIVREIDELADEFEHIALSGAAPNVDSFVQRVIASRKT